jgi:hypothetical protein
MLPGVRGWLPGHAGSSRSRDEDGIHGVVNTINPGLLVSGCGMEANEKAIAAPHRKLSVDRAREIILHRRKRLRQ